MTSSIIKSQRLAVYQQETNDMVKEIAERYGVIDPPSFPSISGGAEIDFKLALAASQRAMVNFTVQLFEASATTKTRRSK